MRYFFNAPSLTTPTFDTLQEYSVKRFDKIEKLLKDIRKSEINLKITVTKERNQYCISAEIYLGNIHKEIIVKVKDPDLRKSIDKAALQLKNEIIKHKERRVNLSRMRRGIDQFREKLRSSY